MKIITDSDSHGGILKLAGEIDLCSAKELCMALELEIEVRPATLIIDLTEVTFMDSCGLSAIIGCWRKLQEQGGKLVIVGATGEVLEIFRLTRLDSLIALFDTKREAWRALDPVS